MDGVNWDMNFEFLPIRTRVVMPPKDEIWGILDGLPALENGDIVFITSKIMAIHQGRTLPVGAIGKEELIRQEADKYLRYTFEAGKAFHLTIKDNILIHGAGIDVSNANEHYILWPSDVDTLCREIREYLCSKHGINDLGVVSTDSHSMPMRRGVMGITIGLAGVEPLKDMRGEKDLFGRPLEVVRVDKIDPLSSMAVLLMGECAECTPIVLLRGYKDIVFSNKASMKDFSIENEADLFAPLLEVFDRAAVCDE